MLGKEAYQKPQMVPSNTTLFISMSNSIESFELPNCEISKIDHSASTATVPTRPGPVLCLTGIYLLRVTRAHERLEMPGPLQVSYHSPVREEVYVVPARNVYCYAIYRAERPHYLNGGQYSGSSVTS